jgi:hypothetical protein
LKQEQYLRQQERILRYESVTKREGKKLMERSPAKKIRQVREVIEEDAEGMDMFKYLGLIDQKSVKGKANEGGLTIEPKSSLMSYDSS